MTAEHDHARDPEEQDLVSSDQQRRRVEDFQIARLLRPAERCEGKQAGGEPGIEHIRDLLDGSTALGAFGWRFAGDDHFLAFLVRARPGWNAMTPPQLPRDA